MITLFDELSAIELGSPVQFRNLTVYPLLRQRPLSPEPDYLLLDEAIASRLICVTELDGGGSVPHLRLENKSGKPVLLLDGEELIGAKQNRTLNLKILAPPKRTITVPVSCVEAGRWSPFASEFKSSAQVMYTGARAARVSQVSQSMHTSGRPSSDQSRIWSDIRAKVTGLKVASPTQAMSDIYDAHAISIEQYVRAIEWQERQAGAAFAISGCMVGFDLFDHPETMKRLYAKLIRSYTLDALDDAATEQTFDDGAAFKTLVRDLSVTRCFSQPAVGLGKDVRFIGDFVSGAALWAEERYVHVCGFTKDADPGTQDLHSRIARPRRRSAHLQQSRTARAFSLLLVDDDAGQLELRACMLRNSGYSVVTTTDPAEAISIANSHSFDLAILDYEMPVMNGCELAARLKHMHPEIKIVLHSGSVDVPGTEMECVDAFVPKGVGVTNLMDRLSEVLTVNCQSKASGVCAGESA